MKTKTKKSNKNLSFLKDNKKSYVYISEKEKTIGLFYYHYTKKKWLYTSYEGEKE